MAATPTPTSPVFRTATFDESPLLLDMINAAYAISEKSIWKPGTVRTNLDDVQSIAKKTFPDQDSYLVATNEENEILGSIRYEPRLHLHHIESGTTHTITFQQIFPELDQLYDLVTRCKVDTHLTTSHRPHDEQIIDVINKLDGEWHIQLIGHFSQFVAKSSVQRSGIGSQLLNHIEIITQQLAKIATSLLRSSPRLSQGVVLVPKSMMEMIVLSPRVDMMNYYEKKGYSRGKTFPPEPYMLPEVVPEYQDLVEYEYIKHLGLDSAQ